MIKCKNGWWAQATTEVGSRQWYSISNSGSTLNLQSKALPNKNSAMQGTSCHSCDILQEGRKNESSLWCWDGKTDLQDISQQRKQNSGVTVSDPSENKQTDPSDPQIIARGSVGGLHSVKGKRASFSKEVLPFKKKWKKCTLQQVVVGGDAWTRCWLYRKRHQ